MNIPKEVLGMLELSSGFARNQVKGLGEKQLLKSRFICSNFCRGYLSGYFEAVVEVNKIPVLNESHLELMKVAGYSYFFSGDAERRQLTVIRLP
jgi:hypothetical protein